MRRKNREIMHISERELDVFTADLDDMHQQSLPHLRDELAEMAETNAQLRSGDAMGQALHSTRRRFLAGAGAGLGAVLVLAACGDDKDSTTEGGAGANTDTTVAGSGSLSEDTRFIAMSASLENLAVATYGAGIQAAQANKLGAVPPAVVRFATTTMKQHKDHADAFNAIVTKAGAPAVTGPNEVVKPLVDAEFMKVKDVVGLAKLARILENSAAATYQDGMVKVSDKESIQRLASIQPVERQHAAILSYVLGEYPIPDTFSSTTKAGEEARPASDFKG